MCAAALVLASLLETGPRVRVDAALETSLQAGSSMPGELGPDALRGGGMRPSVALRLDDRSLQLESRYAARLLATAAGDSPLAIGHDGAFHARWNESRSLTWVADGRFAYGRSAFPWDAGTRRPFDSLENALPLIPDQIQAETAVGLSWMASRGMTAIASLGYSESGGASAHSQQLIPLMRGPQLYAALVRDLSPVDQLTTDLYASATRSSGGRSSSVIKSTTSWNRQLDAATRASAWAGASLDRSVRTALFPVGGATLAREVGTRPSRVELRASALFGPHYSLATAALEQRAELAASARWLLRDSLSLRGRAAAARELAGVTRSGHLLIAAVDVSLRLGSNASLTAGVEALRQRIASDASAPSSAWFAFTALTAGAPDFL